MAGRRLVAAAPSGLPAPALAGRRSVLLGALCAILGSPAIAGCGADPPPAPVPPRPLPPLRTEDLGALLPSAGLVWGVRARPREIAQIAWLIPALALFAPEERLDRFSRVAGFDLRQAPEAWFAGFELGGARGASELQLVRHNAPAMQVERAFERRLSGDVQRSSERADLGRVSGRIGGEVHAFARLGPDVAALQRGGEPERGLARILAERAAGRLAELPGVTRAEPLGALLRRFGSAPFIAFAPGPFEVPRIEGGAARLLAAATALGIGLRPTAREGIGVAIAVMSDFGPGAASASETLRDAWADLAQSELGRMLALDRSRDPPLASHAPDAIALQVELPPGELARGVHALLEQDLGDLLEGVSPR